MKSRSMIWPACILAGLVMFIQAGASPVSFRGKVTSEGKPVSGAAVSDGRSVVLTDAAGRYAISSDGNADFVFISLPSGYEIPVGQHGPAFYYDVSDIENASVKLDFSLVPMEVPDEEHIFVVWADPQVYEKKELDYVRKASLDLKEMVSRKDKPAHLVVCGDIVGDDLDLLVPTAASVSASEVPSFYVVGNHDLDMDARSNDGSKDTFKSIFGPTYYSFNRGRIHYVVLDNSFFIARGWQYVGYLEERQLVWLENDLNNVPEGSTVVVCMHIPTYSRAAVNQEWSKEELNKITTNRNALYDILAPYNVHICSAHEHYAENYLVKDNIFEHVHAPLSGLFWQSFLSCDGLPWGYYVYEVSGDDLKWHYKAIGESEDVQYTYYPVGSNPMKPEAVTVNVWNYDPAWKVQWYEDDICKGEMQRYDGWDPAICADVEMRREKEFKWKYIGAGKTGHLFYAVPSDPKAKIRVEVIDRFGRVCKSVN